MQDKMTVFAFVIKDTLFNETETTEKIGFINTERTTALDLS